MMVCRRSLLPDLTKIVPKKTLAGNGLLVEGMTIQQSISSVTKQIHCVCNGLWWYQQVTPDLHIIQKDNFHGSMSMKLHYRKERLAFNCNEELHFLIT